MKHVWLSLSVCLLSFSQIFAQRSADPGKLGLPGDNLNLAAAMDLFRQSATLEEFERSLNTEDKRVNNLDLNNDGQIDYIRIINSRDGDMHTIVLRTDLNRNEQQDLAVIYVMKENGEVKIQMVGDEALYGKNYIIEPTSPQAKAGTPNPGYEGDANTVVVNNTTTNNYYNSGSNDYYPPTPTFWPIVVYIYQPVYNPWISPWYYGNYPGWWRPWRPWFWDDYFFWWFSRYRWYGWWYYQAPQCYFHPNMGWYMKNKQTSTTVAQNKLSGKYDVSYQNPKPNPNVTVKPNPAARPANEGKETGKPSDGKIPSRTDAKPATDPSRTNPTVRPAGQDRPSVKPAAEPGRKPSYQPSRPSTQPDRSRNYQPSRPSGQPRSPSRPSQPPSRSGGAVKSSGGR
jgi:hypothetical protein